MPLLAPSGLFPHPAFAAFISDVFRRGFPVFDASSEDAPDLTGDYPALPLHGDLAEQGTIYPVFVIFHAKPLFAADCSVLDAFVLNLYP